MKTEISVSPASDQRQELLRLLLKKEGLGKTQPLARVDREQNLPLSMAQERLWFLEQLEPGTAAYNMGGALRMSGNLDIPALERALTHVVARHESLRTTFQTVEGKPAQVISVEQSIPLAIEELRSLPNRESLLQELASREFAHPFDLEHGPLFRAKLFIVDGEDFVLLLTMHHIVSDGWSLRILFREVAQLYSADVQHQERPLKQLTVQYVDFAQWQRDHLQGHVWDKLLSFWKQELAGPLPVLQLPTDHPRPAEQTFTGAHLACELPEMIRTGVKTLSQQAGVTPFMLLLAAFQALLARYSNQTDIIVGTPIAGRNRPEIEDVIGFFANTLVLRTDVEGNPTFRELLQRVKNVAVKAYANQDLPFGKLVAELQPERNLSYPPVFQVMFALESAQNFSEQLPGVELRPFTLESPVSKFDLSLEVCETEHGFTCTFEYNTDLFEAESIRRFAASYQATLRELLSDLDQHVFAYSLLEKSQRHQIVYSWNQTNVEVPDTSIHELISSQTQKTPDRIAAAFEGQALTYSDLDRRSNQLAHYLSTSGIGPGSFVGLLIDRSIEMVIALLGILKSGAAYVPLDPAFPADRIAFMIEDSSMQVVLTRQNLLGSMASSKVKTICLDRDWPSISNESPEDPPTTSNSDTLAYLIYTSGSTGRPKGVQISHRAVTNFLLSMSREPGFTESDVLVAVTTLSFDIAGLELYLPLITGGRLEIASREAALDPNRLMHLLETAGATVMQATPATWRMLIDAGWPGNSGLKMLCGGEAITRELADKLLQLGGELWNLYGPTETTIWSSLQRVEDAEQILIGRPIANTQMYILDEQQSPVPVGVVGELYIGGAGVARGYWQRPALTAEKFIANPFRPGEQMFRTGDLARYRSDGSIECLGRRDHQVKIRGFRVELGEIESAMVAHPLVRQCVAIVREDRPGDQRIVAYIVSADAAEPPSITDLRAEAQRKLPHYMVPSSFVFLSQLPLTPNGKIDRRSLPMPEESRPDGQLGYVPPQNDVELSIANVWQKVLRVAQAGREDNFFELGGHSLLMVEVFNALRSTYPDKLTLIDLFRFPTIRTLAEHIAGNSNAHQASRRAHDRAAMRQVALGRHREVRGQR